MGHGAGLGAQWPLPRRRHLARLLSLSLYLSLSSYTSSSHSYTSSSLSSITIRLSSFVSRLARRTYTYAVVTIFVCGGGVDAAVGGGGYGATHACVFDCYVSGKRCGRFIHCASILSPALHHTSCRAVSSYTAVIHITYVCRSQSVIIWETRTWHSEAWDLDDGQVCGARLVVLSSCLRWERMEDRK